MCAPGLFDPDRGVIGSAGSAGRPHRSAHRPYAGRSYLSSRSGSTRAPHAEIVTVMCPAAAHLRAGALTPAIREQHRRPLSTSRQHGRRRPYRPLLGDCRYWSSSMGTNFSTNRAGVGIGRGFYVRYAARPGRIHEVWRRALCCRRRSRAQGPASCTSSAAPPAHGGPRPLSSPAPAAARSSVAKVLPVHRPRTRNGHRPQTLETPGDRPFEPGQGRAPGLRLADLPMRQDGERAGRTHPWMPRRSGPRCLTSAI